MNNAEKFKKCFGIYATELWAMPEQDFLKWLSDEAKEKQWIPCEERLPEEYNPYLVCEEDGECIVHWLEDADWARRMIKNDGIVAWMPLPDPYVGERKDDE